AYTHYTCRHGIGYSTFVTQFDGVGGEWTLFCHPERTTELWLVELRNLSGRPRRLELCTYFEWCCGIAPDPRREFSKLFIETWFDEERSAVFAGSHMWDVPSERRGHWNTDFPYCAALSATIPVVAAEGDKGAFLGMYNGLKTPEALGRPEWKQCFGRHEDPIAAMRSVITLEPGQCRRLGYALAVSTNRSEVADLVDELGNVEAISAALVAAKGAWRQRLAGQRIDTPDASINHLANDWLRYQAISGRIWGRCGYYQQSGAYGYRDQLQDSQVWLTIAPARCKEQVLLHAAHQFADGSVQHWWHPLTERGLRSQFSDDLLWLAFVTSNYIKETGDLTILNETAPFVDRNDPTPLSEHVQRAFERVFDRTSGRGLPHIGAGDWNDGLSAVGLAGRGESIWLAHFLVGLLADWAEVLRRTGGGDQAEDLARRRDRLIGAINEHAWDGSWYIRATLDDGSKLGAADSDVARIFLNAQTWAVLNDVAPPGRAAKCMRAVKEHLVTDAGPLLLAPAFRVPDPKIGYITRYAPGLRENGGVYTHAACWALAAACKMGDARLASELLKALNPAQQVPERYWAEPYVTPGNIDGPQSPHFGRGGWTWYTGSAAWLQRVIREWILGVRAEWHGLRVQPCLPPEWTYASLYCRYHGADYHIDIEKRSAEAAPGKPTVIVDGEPLPDSLIPPPEKPDEQHEVVVRY
ncbi:MAG: GH36-type glycosyl hydrolase domain-containing protein, partial [Planctomycetota bacterium]